MQTDRRTEDIQKDSSSGAVVIAPKNEIQLFEWRVEGQ
jgi:hypothetical protein